VAVFLGHEARATAPLVPLRFLRHRVRASAYLASVFSASAMSALFYLLTLHLQGVLGWSPLATGLAWTPFGFAMIGGITLGARLARRRGLRQLLPAGFAVAALGLLLLSRVGTRATYPVDILPGTLLIAAGLGLALPVAQSAVFTGTTHADAGLASGVSSTISQLGGCVGLAVFVAVAAARQRAVAAGSSTAVATAAGHDRAWLVAATVLLAGAALVAAFNDR
jgi:predicted MFS family arabinose efflux permease